MNGGGAAREPLVAPRRRFTLRLSDHVLTLSPQESRENTLVPGEQRAPIAELRREAVIWV